MDDRIAVFCHGGFGTAWLSHLLGVPLTQFGLTHEITPTGVTAIHFRNYPSGYTRPSMLVHSDISHILLDGTLPYDYNNEILM